MKHHSWDKKRGGATGEVYKPSKFSFPPDFVLIVDTAEQRPLFTRFPPGMVMQSKKLKDGDYSIAGFEDKICFERKGIGDLFPYCSSERDKTVKKMQRFKEMDFVGLIIEAKESDVLRFQQFSEIHPAVIRGAIVSFEIRYGVHVYYGDRDDCARWMLDRMIKYYNLAKEV